MNLTSHDLIKRFKKFIEAHQLMSPKTPVLLGVSGGLDSVVMCKLFSLCNFNFGVAHCNFRLRGSASDEDEKFVEQFAKEFSAPFFSVHFNTTAIAKERKISIEMAARELRYEWLEKVRKENGYHSIATAHHRDDNIETVLLNLVKGTGIAGLHGILPKREKVIRPLLHFSKNELSFFAKTHGLSFRHDHTNLESVFQRNFLRNKIIPQLEEINPSFRESFSNNIEKFRDAEILYQQALHQLQKKLVQKRGSEIYIPIKKLKMTGAAAKTVLFEILKNFGFSEKQSAQIFDARNAESGRQFFSEGHRAIKDRDFLIIADKAEENSGFILIEDIKKSVKLTEHELRFHLKHGSHFNENAGSKTAFVDFEKLQFPLLLRRWKKGDYFYPLGMKKKKKKISDFFTDIKLSALEKERTWILMSGEKIVWLVGHRIDERFKVSENTKQTLEIKLR